MALSDGNKCPSERLRSRCGNIDSEESERLFPFKSAFLNDKSDGTITFYKVDVWLRCSGNNQVSTFRNISNTILNICNDKFCNSELY